MICISSTQENHGLVLLSRPFTPEFRPFATRIVARTVPVEKTTFEETTVGMWGPEPAATQKPTPQVDALLKVLSIFHCNGILEKLLIEGVRYVRLRAYPKTRLDYEKVRDELLRHTFVGWDSEKNELSIHKLLQDIVRKKMDKEELETLCDSGILLISAVRPLATFETRKKVWRWPILEACLPHITQSGDLYNVSYTKKPGVIGMCGSTEAAILFNDAAW